MQHEEILLTNYYLINRLLDMNITIKQIHLTLNQKLNINITYRQLRALINKVRTNRIHREYNDVVVIDSLKDAWDKKLGKYCVDFHGLLVTYKKLAKLTDPEFIITSKNITAIYGRNSILYAKRILKLYHISDEELLEEHKSLYPRLPDINLSQEQEAIHSNLKDEFDELRINLMNKYVEFVINNIKMDLI